MKLNNEATIYSIHVIKMVGAVLILLVLTLLLTTSLDEIILQATGISQTWVMVVLVMLYMLLLLYFRLRKTSYFSYNDEGSKLVVKSYRIGASASKKWLYEIPKANFFGYKVDKHGLREELILYIKIGNKLSEYPPVSISAITRAQKDNLLKQLDSYIVR